jgi:hypothetical protein
MARLARLALADQRALEKEGERQNPISEVRGGSFADVGKKAIALHRAEHRMIGHGKGSEAHYQGYALGRHMKRLHGNDFHHSFTEGVMGGGLYDTDSSSDEEESNDNQNWVNGSGRDRNPEGNPVGFGTGAYEGMGHCVGGASGGRSGGKSGGKSGGASGGKRKPGNNRYQVVKKVMAEKGMSMIEASKYVKAHNLY